MEQERLLIEAAQKDPKRFAELYESNFERVYAFVVRRVQDRHEAEDELRRLEKQLRQAQRLEAPHGVAHADVNLSDLPTMPVCHMEDGSDVDPSANSSMSRRVTLCFSAASSRIRGATFSGEVVSIAPDNARTSS